MFNYYLFIFIILIPPIFSFKNNYWRIKREWEEGKNKNIKSFLSHQEIFREERWQLPLENNQNNFNIKRYLLNGIPVHQYKQKSKRHNNPHNKMNAAGFFYISADFPTFSLNGEENNENQKFNDLPNEDCSMYPNGTFNAPYAFTCSDPENGPPIFVVHDTALANRSGHYEYPLELSDITPMLRIFMDLTSYATQSFESMRAEVALLRRKVGWLGCGWINIPTFGALDLIDICEDNEGCPIFPGRQVLELQLEPAHVFLAMLRLMLRDHKPPYELRLRLVNNRNNNEELLCVAFQTRIIF
uniref:Uncharacterized protein n=1 Tax=Meloidogyne enterolobii TaxID=390850 RepID=A0A6V7VMP0_MELEN|nr:unnamed protein product [Meloidogyne enterolobii]